MLCAVDGCTTPAHARGMCTLHYGRWRRAHPEADIRFRASPNAPITERIGLHSHRDGDHLMWCGYVRDNVPSIRVPVDGRRRTFNVRAVQLDAAGRPKPAGRWIAVNVCGVPMCVDADHLDWSDRIRERILDPETIDNLVARHAAGTMNVTDEADRLGVDRRTVYQAMASHGYRPGAATTP